MERTYRKLQILLSLSLFLFAAVALFDGARGQARAEPAGAAPESISVCIAPGPGIPVVLAQEQSLFSKEGLQVTIKKYGAGSLAFDSMLAGECDMATVGETPLVMKSFERQDFTILATLVSSDDATRILANKERGIQRAEDLKGKTIFVHKNTTNHFFLEMFLMKNGVSPKEVTLIFKDVEDYAEAFATGRIDAVVGTDALIRKPRQALGDKGIVFSSSGLCLNTFNLVTMQSVIKEKPQVVRKVVKTLLKSAEVLTKDRQQAIRTLAKAMNTNEQDMAATLQVNRWDVGLAQTLLLSLEQEAQWAMDSGLTTKTHIPNYLNFIHRDVLHGLKPEAVTIMR